MRKIKKLAKKQQIINKNERMICKNLFQSQLNMLTILNSQKKERELKYSRFNHCLQQILMESAQSSNNNLQNEEKKRIYNHYGLADRLALIQKVVNQKQSLSSSAKQLKICQTTARLIISTFLNQGRVFEKKEDKEKRLKKEAKLRGQRVKSNNSNLQRNTRQSSQNQSISHEEGQKIKLEEQKSYSEGLKSHKLDQKGQENEGMVNKCSDQASSWNFLIGPYGQVYYYNILNFFVWDGVCWLPKRLF